MAKKNKHRPPSSPAADPVSSKRRRLTRASATPPASAASARESCARSAAPAAPAAPTVYVVAGSKIQAKVRATVAALSADTKTTPPPPSAADGGATGGSVKPASAHEGNNGVVLLEARAPAASKLITVAEVAKRTLDGEQKRWWAYTGVKGVLEEFDAARKPAASEESDDFREGLSKEDGEGDSEDEAFEPLQRDQSSLSSKKVRNVPVLVMYLATRPVPELKALYEEQCSKP